MHKGEVKWRFLLPGTSEPRRTGATREDLIWIPAPLTRRRPSEQSCRWQLCNGPITAGPYRTADKALQLTSILISGPPQPSSAEGSGGPARHCPGVRKAYLALSSTAIGALQRREGIYARGVRRASWSMTFSSVPSQSHRAAAVLARKASTRFARGASLRAARAVGLSSSRGDGSEGHGRGGPPWAVAPVVRLLRDSPKVMGVAYPVPLSRAGPSYGRRNPVTRLICCSTAVAMTFFGPTRTTCSRARVSAV